MADAVFTMGADAPGSSDMSDSGHAFASIHAKAFTDGQMRQWGRDPFGPLRQRQPVLAFVAAAAAGGVNIAGWSGLAGIGSRIVGPGGLAA